MSDGKVYSSTLRVFLTCCSLFLFACGSTSDGSVNGSSEIEEIVHPMELDPELFQKNIGWLDSETLLIHKGSNDSHQFTSYNIFTGDFDEIYEENAYILSAEISHSRNQILFQEVSDEGISLNVMDLSGEILHSTPLHYSGYVTLDWNAVDPDLIFVSHYDYDSVEEVETILVQVWNTEEDTLTRKPIASLYPTWYSSNVYVYVDELEGRDLYIGDMREENGDMVISRDVRDFFLHQDTFIGIVPSDINEHQVYLFHEYPFLVGDNVITAPKVSMNDQPVKPHLTQSNRNGKVLAVLADEPVILEEELGTYTLSQLDFESETVEEILSLPYDAPICLSPDENHVLYGWRYEYLIELDSGEMHALIDSSS